ncbi:hypothetical protein [Paenibacillus crassostreae]|uniref:Uncharacterized protein n=1 Tax=Paenibacillus crassostreae TaxID=1763538 RepID=A0A167FFU6_9BACL|nr:hypothetical protein [Paenibacillus crassostreae]AOZ94447.1 hypothetical protein LPB68_21085 [Paenibacillus crassostreae]OAB76515.1 hypothetical protein PNBC_03655 [Paenibacillus crassostreae]
MMRTLNTLLVVRTSTVTNLFIYYIQKLPVMGKYVTDSIYANADLKKVISIIVFLINLLSGFVNRLVYVGLLIYLPVVGLGSDLSAEDQFKYFVHIYFLLSFVVAGVSSATILEPKREKYVAVKLMRLSPTKYMKATLVYRYVTFMVYLLPAMIIFASLLGASITESILLVASVTLWRILTEYLHLKLFDTTGMVLIKNTVIVWTVIGIGYAVAYMPLLFDLVPVTLSFLLSLPICIVLLGGGIFAVVRLSRNSNYRGAVDAATKRDDLLLDFGRMMAEAEKTSVKSKESDYALKGKHQEKIGNKVGYDYLNVLFFSRHRSLINEPVYKRMAITGAFGLVGVVVVMMLSQRSEFTAPDLGVTFPYLVFVMYLLSVGEKMSKAMFYNCDNSLLRYSFYRASASEHFRIRLIKIMSLNLRIATVLAAALTAITIVAGGEWLTKELILMWVCILSLSVFFSIHHLFMYYIFQPYTSEMNVKNPLYFVVNMCVSIASGISIVLRAPAGIFTAIIVTLTLLYLFTSLNLVRKYGSHTFRVK